MARCAADICYWVDTYGKTFDPRELETDPVLPFVLFPRQREFLLWLQGREKAQKSGLAEKSRDVGFTWLCCAYAVHGWLFRKGFTVGFGSRKLELVDKIGDPKCIFEKIRFLVAHLPDWMLPAGFDPKRHSGRCKLVNPANGASISGEGGAQIGRGGRTSLYFIDEAAFLQYPKLADAALSANSRVKIWVSTPNGPGNAFAEKRFGGKFDVFTFHWKDDPRKDEDWYAQQREELGDVALAQEVDIDYTASVEGICIPARWARAAVHLIASERFREVFPDYVPSGRPVCSLDIAAGGKNRTVYMIRQGIELQTIRTWSENGTVTAHKAAEATEAVNGCVLHYDPVGVGFAVQSALEVMFSDDADRRKSERQFHFQPNGILGGAAPSETVWPNGKTSAEMFLNRRAELYVMLRTRFEKTFEFVEQGISHPAEEMISIPNDAQLLAELCVPLMLRTETGKIKIESKEAMARRGVASPDYADALVYTEAGAPANWSEVLTVAEASRQDSVFGTDW